MNDRTEQPDQQNQPDLTIDMTIDVTGDTIRVTRPDYLTDEQWDRAKQAITRRLDELVADVRAGR